MKRLAVALVAAAGLAGCGSGTETVTVTTPNVGRDVPPTVPADRVIAPPDSARIPDGASGSVLPYRQTEGLKTLPRTQGGVVVSNRGVNFVGGFEGFASCPYWDAYGHVWTRGYGETDFRDHFGGRCVSRAFGLYNLRRLLNVSYLWPVRRWGTHFTQCQVDAMASASYNLGPGILTGHASLLRAKSINWLLGYDHAGGVRLWGLTRRRRAEVALFHSSRCGKPPAPETRAHKQARLRAAKKRIVVLRAALASHGCYKALKRHHAGPKCRRWKREGNARNAEVRKLHREGVR